MEQPNIQALSETELYAYEQCLDAQSDDAWEVEMELDREFGFVRHPMMADTIG